jgi:phospholipid/cholesterol/gamma-HCH transport system permease protein
MSHSMSPAGAAPSSHHFPRTQRKLKSWANGWNRVGHQTWFYTSTLLSTGYALAHYRIEVLRLIAQMSLGAGALAVIGGTVGVVGFLTISTGALTAVQGYNSLAGIGVEALQGFTSAYIVTRVIAPLVAGIALAATIGAGATAQLGAMRINDEIDALEVMSIRARAYLASTRVIAGIIVVVPLYGIGLLCAYTAGRFATTYIYGQSTGVYDHYFNTFLNPTDLIWSFFEAITMAVVVMLVHTYYGFTAWGGPAGVGEATGRAVRTSLIALVAVTLFVSLAIYGQSGAFNLSG